MIKADLHRIRVASGAWHTKVRVLLVACVCLLPSVSSGVVRGGAPAGALVSAPLGVVWQALPAASASQGSELPATKATLSLTNTGREPLPPAGWSLWFTCMAGVQVGAAGETMLLEKAAGTLYRLRPGPGFTGLAPGATLHVPIAHQSPVGNPGKGPDGVYFNFDSTPEAALPVRDFVVKPMPAEVQYVTPADLYRRHAAALGAAPVELPPVFPPPREWQRSVGQLRWEALPPIESPAALRREAETVRSLLGAYLPAGNGARGPVVRLVLAPPGSRVAAEISEEAYELRVDPREGVTITGRTPAGVALGIASLHEMLPVEPALDRSVSLPALLIRDAPRFAYRGLMLDVARNFQPASEVRRVLGLMARYKLNKLHLHLTDDEGWRIEIPGLPELTTFGARRGPGIDENGHLMPAHGSGASLANAYASGYYTRRDYQSILHAAAALHIEVIPEIEMPGHARAAVRAMAWRARQSVAAHRMPGDYRLDDPRDESAYLSAQAYSDNVMNPALPSTYAFIAHVADELLAMHREAGVPLRTLHVGGDELPAGAWSASPAVNELKARLGVVERADVWRHFYRRVSALLAERGVAMAGWEEIALREPAIAGAEFGPETPPPAGQPTAWVWNTRNLERPDDGDTDVAVRLANAGTPVVLAPASRFYFDLMHFHSPAEPGHDWAGRIDLDTAFDFVPFDPSRSNPLEPTRSVVTEPLTVEGRRRVRGLEGTLFSELVHSPGRLDYLLMPRLLALAERAWSPDPAWASASDRGRAEELHRADWTRFATQVGTRVLPRLDAEHSGWLYRIPPPGLLLTADGVRANSQLPGLQLRYTTDGSEPNSSSATVDGPISSSGTIRVAAFTRDGRRGPVSSIDPTEPLTPRAGHENREQNK